MDMGKDPSDLLADANCFWANARTPSDNFGGCKTSGRIDIHHCLYQIQNLADRSPEPLPSRQKWLQIQVARNSSVCLVFTNDPQQDGVAWRIGLQAHWPLHPRRGVPEKEWGDHQRHVHANLVRVAHRPYRVRPGRTWY